MPFLKKKITKLNVIDTWVVRQFEHEYNPTHWHSGHISGAGFLKVPSTFGKHTQKKNKEYYGGSLQLISGSRMFLSPSVVTIKPKSGFKNSKIYAETANSLTVNCSGATSCVNLKILCPTKSKSVCKAIGNVPSTLKLYCPLGNDKSCDASGGSIQYMERNGMAASWAKDTVKSVGRQPSNYSCTKIRHEYSTAYECRRKCLDTMTCNLVVRYGCMATANLIRKEDKDVYHCILYTCQNISKITWVPNVENLFPVQPTQPVRFKFGS